MDAKAQAMQQALITYLQSHVLAPGVAITAESDLPELGIDSVTIVELAMHLEERFSIEIPVAQLTPEHTRTVRNLAECAIRFGKPLR